MNSFERVRIALNHQQPDRVPMLLWMTPEISMLLKKHFNLKTDEDVYDKLDIDVRWLLVDYCGPTPKTYENGSKENEFGMRFRVVENQFGRYEEFSYHPLAKAMTPADINDFHWPDPDWWDYSSITREIIKADCVEPRWLGIGYASLFERAWGLTGYEKLLADMLMNPELVESIFDHLLEFYLEQTSRILAAANNRINMVYIADDLASQDSLLFSPDMFRHFLKGRWKYFIDTLKTRFGNHLTFHFHSCGAVANLIPDLIDMGVDVLNPIQPKAKGMEPNQLKVDYGNQLCFSGGFDIQELLPRGSTQEIKQETQRLVSILGKDGGYIASAAHAIQPDTSIENVLALINGFKNAE